jgi:hypothetical protein
VKVARTILTSAPGEAGTKKPKAGMDQPDALPAMPPWKLAEKPTRRQVDDFAPCAWDSVLFATSAPKRWQIAGLCLAKASECSETAPPELNGALAMLSRPAPCSGAL